MMRVLAPSRPAPVALVLLALAAICVLVAGFQHGRLYHRGYAEVEIIGLLFLVNAIGSTAVVLTLIFDCAWLFVLGALSICGPSLASIALSHSSGLLGFREGGYPEMLMPVDYGQRIGDADVEALAAFVVAASGSDD
ncbi:MAG: hypothetical protein Q8O56_13320 [Solirubrobacteraceae bacterium]|nr:hypothetical protein [Solirubrobacteraceae bacterium]